MAGSNRIAGVLSTLGTRKMLVPFFTAGFPDMKTSMKLIETAAACGCDMIEIGMPFSDPMADGPQIQYSSHVALANGTNLDMILDGVRQIRETVQIPLILMGYYNPIIAHGEKRFLREAAEAGVDGFIIPDLPVEEAGDFSKCAESIGLSMIFLVSPTSSPKRVRLIDRSSTDLVYALTVTGVTGSGRKFGQDTDDYLKSLKQRLRKRFVAGFGVSSPASAERLGKYADGVVIGSALVKIIRQAPNNRKATAEVERFLKSVRKAL